MPGKHARGFAAAYQPGHEMPPGRRCSALVQSGKNAGQRCPNWTIRAPAGSAEEWLPLCAAHAGVPQRRWHELSEEKRAEKLRAHDAARKREARARAAVEKVHADAEAREAAERELHRLRQLEIERERLARLAEDRARYTPPDFPKLQPGELWVKQRTEAAKARHADEIGPFNWAIESSLTNLRREVDQILVASYHERNRIMRPRRPEGRDLVNRLNAKRKRQQADQDALLRSP